MEEFTNTDLDDLDRALDAGMRSINIFSPTFSRWNALQKRIQKEKRRRKLAG